MRLYLKVASVICLIALCRPASAQTFSVSTDLLGYARLGTMNLDASYAVSRRWSVIAGARYNPFTFRKGDPEKQFQSRQQSYAVGMRLWPWHTWSGWWFAGKLRYQEYNEGGILSITTEEGDRFGAGLYAGYTHSLTWNLEPGGDRIGWVTGLELRHRMPGETGFTAETPKYCKIPKITHFYSSYYTNFKRFLQ